jgi:hypothetical protein
MRGLRIGFNHNVLYKGRVFHVQSEDMGCRYAYAITHVFNDVGRVVKTRKLSYAEFQKDTQVMSQITELLREQHTHVVEEVAQGLFDAEVPPSGLLGPVDSHNPPSSLMPRSHVRPVRKPDAAAPSSELSRTGQHTSRA